MTAGTRLGTGGQAEIWTVAEDSTLAYKRYKRHHATPEIHQKLIVMTSNVPADPTHRIGHPSIAWPIDVVLDEDGSFQGFVMPRVDNSIALPLFRFYNPLARSLTAPLLTWRYLFHMATNLASAVDAIHAAGYVVGDLNESNVLGTGTALITLVDCDSTQVRDPDTGRLFCSPVGKAEYLPPELQGADLPTTERVVTSDYFSLAVLIYLLLMEGAHPFLGVWSAPGEPPSMPERIRRGLFPPAASQLVSTPPFALPFATLPPQLQGAFLRVFGAGIANPAARPTAAEWHALLDSAQAGLVSCVQNSQHIHSDHLLQCPWCVRVKGGVPDPYPNVGIQTGLPRISLAPTTATASSARRTVTAGLRSPSRSGSSATAPVGPMPAASTSTQQPIRLSGAWDRRFVWLLASFSLLMVAIVLGRQASRSSVDTPTITTQITATPSTATAPATTLPLTTVVTAPAPPTTKALGPPVHLMDYRERRVAESVNIRDNSPAAINGKSFTLIAFGIIEGFGNESQMYTGSIDFNLSRSFRSFKARVGVTDTSRPGEPNTIRVLADGRTVYENVFELGSSDELDIDVTGVLRLRVEITGRFFRAKGAIGDPVVAA